MHLVIAAILAASRKKHGVCLTRTRLTVGKTAGVIPFKDVIHLFTTDCLKYCCLFLIAPEHIVKLKHVSPDTPPLLMRSVFISRAPPLFHGELPHTPPWLRSKSARSSSGSRRSSSTSIAPGARGRGEKRATAEEECRDLVPMAGKRASPKI